MAGFDHGPALPTEPEDMTLAARNARYGMVLFLIYLAVYGGFVALNGFWPEVTSRAALFGVNLAVMYGFGLIILAMILALVYCWLCRKRSPSGSKSR